MAVKVSIIIPVYNVEKYISECLDSLLVQTMKDIEIICVDDGSTDHSLEILRQYQEKDPRVIVLTQKNQFAGIARNNGMAIAKGDYLIFLDSDDFFEPTLVEKMYKAAKEKEAEVVVCRADRFENNTNKKIVTPWTIHQQYLPDRDPFTSNDVTRNFFSLFVWWPWDKIFKRSYIESLGIQYQGLRTTNDLFFVCAAVISAPGISHIDDILIHQRCAMTSSLSVTREKSWDCFYKALIALRDYLQEKGLYERFERDFINYCLNFSLWHLQTLQGNRIVDLYNALRTEWYDEWGVTSHRKEYFYSTTEYNKLKYILNHDVKTYIKGRETGKEFQLETDLTETSDQDQNEIAAAGKESKESCKMPKVSIVLPIYNVEMYLRQCLDSVIHQTLKDIEIICVNDGSTDHSLDIIKEYAAKDQRIKIIDKPNSGYGTSMNRGIDMATGEYLGIVEPDDFVRLSMFEDLSKIADETGADIVKADFYRFVGEGDSMEKVYIKLDPTEMLYGRILDPRKVQPVFKCVMNTWSGIYRMDFLNKYKIRHNETPGASFQDNGFWLKGFFLSHKIYFVNQPYYMNRRDNPNSSVHNRAKVYCANDEYAYIKKFMIENNLFDTFKKVFYMKLWHNCRFTYGRIAEEFKLEYLQRVHDDLGDAALSTICDREFFSDNECRQICEILTDYVGYYDKLHGKKWSPSGHGIFKSRNPITTCIKCYQENGFAYTYYKILVHMGLRKDIR